MTTIDNDVTPDPATVAARLDRATKVRLLSGMDFWQSEAAPSVGLDHVMFSDGPHGIRRQIGDTDHVGFSASEPATCFPTAVTLGSTWDVDLLTEVGVALGTEARALGVDVLLGPGLNLVRHPAGGRSFEYLSEDPLLSGRLAGALVRGVQAQGVGACLKHYAVNNQEHFRMRVDAVVDERTLRELYLAGFEIAVTESRPWTIMSAYNLVNGEHAGESRRLLTDILRDEWGFDGLVMSDWYATADRATGVHAGMDLEMPGSNGAWDAEVHAALDAGTLTDADLDTAVARLVQLDRRIDRTTPAPDPGDVHDDHHALARRAAAAGTVLLTNDGILPLADDTTVGLVGAFATTPRYQGGGSSKVNPTRVDDLRTHLDDRLGTATAHADGYDPATGTSTAAQVAEAVQVAAAADVVVLVVGLPNIHESEGWDRDTLALPADMDALVRAVTAVNDRTVVVLQNGAAVELPWADRPAAIVEAWLGGQAGGAALADVLTGDVEPGGRLAVSIPTPGTNLPAAANFANHPTQVVHRETQYVGYRFHDTFDVAPAFCFGHGLGYTTWSFGDATVSGDGTDLTVTVPVTNTGDRRGTQVVQLYVHDVASTLHRPVQELKAFAKVALEPGESTDVTLALDRRAFAVWDVASSSWRVEAGTFDLRVGTSSQDIRTTVTVDVASEDEVTPVATPAAALATDAEFAVLLGHPIPAPRPLTPYHRDTTFADLEASALGRVVQTLIRAGQQRRMREDTDEESMAMIDAAMRAGPLRLMAMATENPNSLRVLDGLIRVLNLTRGRR